MSDVAGLLLIDALLCFVIVVMLQVLPIGKCDRCPHCKDEERRKSDEAKRLNERYCWRCNSSHPEGRHDR